jgi:hypothetical protein
LWFFFHGLFDFLNRLLGLYDWLFGGYLWFWLFCGFWWRFCIRVRLSRWCFFHGWLKRWFRLYRGLRNRFWSWLRSRFGFWGWLRLRLRRWHRLRRSHWSGIYSLRLRQRGGFRKNCLWDCGSRSR